MFFASSDVTCMLVKCRRFFLNTVYITTPGANRLRIYFRAVLPDPWSIRWCKWNRFFQNPLFTNSSSALQSEGQTEKPSQEQSVYFFYVTLAGHRLSAHCMRSAQSWCKSSHRLAQWTWWVVSGVSKIASYVTIWRHHKRHMIFVSWRCPLMWLQRCVLLIKSTWICRPWALLPRTKKRNTLCCQIICDQVNCDYDIIMMRKSKNIVVFYAFVRPEWMPKAFVFSCCLFVCCQTCEHDWTHHTCTFRVAIANNSLLTLTNNSLLTLT